MRGCFRNGLMMALGLCGGRRFGGRVLLGCGLCHLHGHRHCVGVWQAAHAVAIAHRVSRAPRIERERRYEQREDDDGGLETAEHRLAG